MLTAGGGCLTLAPPAWAMTSTKITAKPPNYTGIIDDIGDMVVAAMNAYDYDVKSSGASDVQSDGIRLNEMGMAIGGAIKTARTMIDAAVKKSKGGELTPEDLLKLQ